MKSKIELEWAEQLEERRRQFTVLQCEITVAADRKEHLIKVYVCTSVFIIRTYVCTICVCVLCTHVSICLSVGLSVSLYVSVFIHCACTHVCNLYYRIYVRKAV